MIHSDPTQAWSRFWAQGGSGRDSGCLPNSSHVIDGILSGIWREVAASAPRRARVLDLATGDGVVLAKLRAARPDLKSIGVDSSPLLPPPPKGIKLKAGIAMEDLPFRGESFDVVTSQFGVEYGDMSRIAAEVSRVLTSGGCLGFVVHHRDGPIVAHNLARREALDWAASGSGHWDKALALARARMAMRLPTPPVFMTARAEARKRFPSQPVAEEFTLAIAQTLELSRNAPPREAVDALVELRDRAANEMARIDALARAALDCDGIERLAAYLNTAGIVLELPTGIQHRAEPRPFAWLVRGRKPRD